MSTEWIGWLALLVLAVWVLIRLMVSVRHVRERRADLRRERRRHRTRGDAW
ncbi:hypothetical protein ACQPX6_17545 [Actinomycetospora sp. CA-101289]|uniref:hypothetical protein n=1 Tax=Actinomycetospora sp. CA-101289 TaxID=3239893 RepID=UPI003D97FC02